MLTHRPRRRRGGVGDPHAASARCPTRPPDLQAGRRGKGEGDHADHRGRDRWRRATAPRSFAFGCLGRMIGLGMRAVHGPSFPATDARDATTVETNRVASAPATSRYASRTWCCQQKAATRCAFPHDAREAPAPCDANTRTRCVLQHAITPPPARPVRRRRACATPDAAGSPPSRLRSRGPAAVSSARPARRRRRRGDRWR